ncbi:RNA polymerase sigma factor [Pedobacter frigoris]|uniref:Sigma-70 family RNA polymerase sigma factor n=1 Tax=Pedobacter frigoris TaxID=2571272 RepID=A0A4U1CMK6_9SPHI|nr:sigma-70 family RNA polymerase sigma factor [Pedobacter frigoris]TKC09107.1 sigma-70 family RNA polymerase sigma factor [Pedobacter frigoris]
MYPDNSQSLEDNALLLQLSEGNKHAFDILYNKYWKQVFNAAYKRLNNIEQSQDIAQDVFVQLWTRGSKTQIENLPAYLLVAARNGVFKKMEKEAKYSALPDVAEQLESPFGGADSGVLHQEFLIAFNELVNTLPTQQRIIFKMRFEEELSSQQIADQLELSPKTVRNQLGKALSSLRSSMLLMHLLLFLYQGR